MYQLLKPMKFEPPFSNTNYTHKDIDIPEGEEEWWVKG
jgi:hypothetical protein